jgi:hypothetical protein
MLPVYSIAKTTYLHPLAGTPCQPLAGLLGALKVEGFLKVSGSSEPMKQVYYRYLNRLNGNCLLYISLASSSRCCMISLSHQTFKHSVASMMSSCRLSGAGVSSFFALEKTRSHSIDIAGIERVSSAISVPGYWRM